MEPAKAAEILKEALKGHRGDLTVADAAAKSGLALRDAERGLHHLLTEYPGQLSATEDGHLLFRFPRGFSVPLFQRRGWQRFWDKAKKTALGVGKFVVRAWISIVLIAYVAVFLALAIALAFSRQSSDDRDGGGGFALVWILLRVVTEALFWTFHPFSPFAYRNVYDERSWQPRRREKKKEPFYAKVNRFVFGPEDEPVDPRDTERRILSQMRAQRGRIGIADVMKVTGLRREEADAMMSRLMLDYDGTVEVSEDGGVFYRFPEIRKTAGVDDGPVPPPVWSKRVEAKKLTGNDAGSNFLIAALNGFNLLMSLFAMGAGLTIERLQLLLQGIPPELLPAPGTPIVLGVVPFVFSLLLYALPLYRAATSGAQKKKAARENARRSILRVVLEGAERGGVDEARLKRAWKDATGEEPDDKELVREVVALGGDVEVKESGRAQFRFRDLEAELEALKKERAEASAEEARVGQVVFSSGS